MISQFFLHYPRLSLVLLLREDSLERYQDHFSPSLTCRENEVIRTNSSFGLSSDVFGAGHFSHGKNLWWVNYQLTVYREQTFHSHHACSQWWRCHMETNGWVGQFLGTQSDQSIRNEESKKSQKNVFIRTLKSPL